MLWVAVAAGVALAAGWSAATAGDAPLSTVCVILLGAAAVIGVVPVGRYAPHRQAAAPAFGAAAAFAVGGQPSAELLPTQLGSAALVAAVVAGVGRALGGSRDEYARVWMVGGVAVALAGTGASLLGLSPAVVWSLLLVGSMLAARVVPALAVDVPDQLLVDMERLAVTAWSARERPPGRRGRTLVSRPAVARVAERGARLVTAASVAVAAVAGISSWLVLHRAGPELDLLGARLLALFAGAGLLLAARSYRHRGARSMLQSAGVATWAGLAATVAPGLTPGRLLLAALTLAAVAVAMLVAAVATGRGWRSAWWARRAEVAEGVAGSLAVAALVVSTGAFRLLWEWGSSMFSA
ncbi:MAG: hypothetical protein R2731_09715 [Nocardioides sp.]